VSVGGGVDDEAFVQRRRSGRWCGRTCDEGEGEGVRVSEGCERKKMK